MAKDATYKRLIQDKRWMRLRRAKLSETPLCERCTKEGRVRAATEVHHVVPIESAISEAEKTRLAYDFSNLQSLCRECHTKTHTEMGSRNRDFWKKRKAQQLVDFEDKFLK
ncbi:HNH endonuclease signature motif containing protein [Alloprevotella tannerae]|uniref:HNH endonuclease signature motif containing protein n=1 Tax=Alloprevotella tannerae TaxID=76122 RepID=UPI0028E38DDC|nr:HNH endonuclease signature motif containing protein [Alloprevotella tannerae]